MLMLEDIIAKMVIAGKWTYRFSTIATKIPDGLVWFCLFVQEINQLILKFI